MTALLITVAAFLQGSAVAVLTPKHPSPATVTRGDGAQFVEGSSQFAGFDFAVVKTVAGYDGPPKAAAAAVVVRITTNATTVPAGGGWVDIAGSCGTMTNNNTAGWWIGLFPASAPSPIKAVNPSSLPGNNSKSPFTPPFTMPAPPKFTGAARGGSAARGESPTSVSPWSLR